MVLFSPSVTEGEDRDGTEPEETFFLVNAERSTKPLEDSRVAGLARKGDSIGEFTLISRLGSGGMGEVWEATQASLNRRVALKLILPDRVSEKSVDYFEREARAGIVVTLQVDRVLR